MAEEGGVYVNASLVTDEEGSQNVDEPRIRVGEAISDDVEWKERCTCGSLRKFALSLWITPEGNLVSQPSNQALLFFACISFLVFAIAEIFGALVSNSLSLLGDASTMIVDAMTYGINMYAEYKKPKVSKAESLRYELYAPLFSITILFGISVYIIYDAVQTLLSPADGNVNDAIMLGFAVINLIFDFLNMGCFYRAQRLFGFPVAEDEDMDIDTNTNMCSAYTHVIADTFRSIAVLLAAGASSMSDSIDSEYADAWAAIVVSLIIFATTVPLLKGLKEKYMKLQDHVERMNAEEALRTTSLLNSV